jgi:hypothetical protein
MSDTAAIGDTVTGRLAVHGRQGAALSGATWRAPDARRALQLCLAAVWLLDAVLQYQNFMFTKAFGQMLAGTAAGNPGVISRPITWSATIIEHHPVPTNAAFATIQLLLAIGIAYRPTVKIALGASVIWAVAVWWFGEGLGGVLNSGASPVNGAPGAVIIYALLAVLLWPAGPGQAAGRFLAARPVGTRVAQGLWVVLWGSLAYFSLIAANRAPQALHDMISGMASGNPGWLASIVNGAARLVNHQGLAASIVLAVLLAFIAVSVLMPVPVARTGVIVAIVLAAVIWVAAEALGGIFSGSGTDPNSGPLLALLALAYWPSRAARPAAATPATAEISTPQAQPEGL